MTSVEGRAYASASQFRFRAPFVRLCDMRERLSFPREVLLIEIVRACAGAECNARTRVGLTKAEARAYKGFECERCTLWNEDTLDERDIPEWWAELNDEGLETLRPREARRGADGE